MSMKRILPLLLMVCLVAAGCGGNSNSSVAENSSNGLMVSEESLADTTWVMLDLDGPFNSGFEFGDTGFTYYTCSDISSQPKVYTGNYRVEGYVLTLEVKGGLDYFDYMTDYDEPQVIEINKTVTCHIQWGGEEKANLRIERDNDEFWIPHGPFEKAAAITLDRAGNVGYKS